MERDRDVIDDETYTAGRSAAGEDRADLDYGAERGATTDGVAATDTGLSDEVTYTSRDAGYAGADVAPETTGDAAYRDDSYLDTTRRDGLDREPVGDDYAAMPTMTDAGVDDDVTVHREHGAEALGAGAGALGGAAIGMAVGGPPGAVIGGLVGAAAGAVAGEASEGDDETGSGIGGVGGGAAGAVVGGAVAGPPGAVVGGAVGAGAGAGVGDKTEEGARRDTEPDGHSADEGTLNDGSVRDESY